MKLFKTTLLLTGLTSLFLLIGHLVGGPEGMVVAFMLAVVMNFFSYWFSDKIVLAMYGAKPVTEAEAPELLSIVRKLSIKASIPMPRVYMIPSSVPNAFATGRNPEHAAIAATAGIMERLTPRELEAVLGHELSHVLNRDILISTLAATIAGAIMMLAHMARWAALFGGNSRERNNNDNLFVILAMVVLAPLAASLIQMAVSRTREFEADRGGARLTGDPLALASALEKISDENAHARVPLTNNPATAHLFIANPLRAEGLMTLFSTHPPTEERIKRLEAMAAETSGYIRPKVIH